MPLYEYHCRQCGENFEVRQKFADEPLTNHEGCGGPVERLVSVPALQFKGTGWYVTDYGRNGKVPPSSDNKAKTETKSDSKTEATKTESKKTESKSESKPSSSASPPPSKAS
ncbi:MAG: zinc ribbon domain-containing protein [Acidobacteriia bacterium]|nr:zinc ribbon domain-containing protein [Terriglobia bacterium]